MVVAGGGLAGICAAVAAERLGLRIAFIENRPVLGGSASSEIRVNPIGKTEFPPYPRNGEIVRDLLHREPQKSYSEDLKQTDIKRQQIVTNEKNITLLLNTHATEVHMDRGRIQSITCMNVKTGERLNSRRRSSSIALMMERSATWLARSSVWAAKDEASSMNRLRLRNRTP